MNTFKKHPLFKLVFGQKTSLRFRIVRKLMGRNACLRVGKSIMEVPEDMLWAFNDGDYYEKNVSYWLEKILLATKHKVFYDVGANYGYYCLKLAHNASHIYAFEPVCQTHNILLKNILKNNITNITVYKLGISDTEGSKKINLYSSCGNNSLFSRDIPQIGQEVISLVTLDDIFQNERLNPPDLIKIDIEGGELYALKGAKEMIKKYQPALFIEYLEVIFKDAGYSRSDLLTELKADNYVIYGIPEDVDDLMLYPLEKFEDIAVGNIIALPKSMEDALGDVAR